jgi:hypothetical protein
MKTCGVMKKQGLIWNSGNQEQKNRKLHTNIESMILKVESLKIINPYFRSISVS